MLEDVVNKTLYERDVVDMSDLKLGEDYFYTITGTASWYGKKFHLRKTANGELFNMYEYTAAHRDLPFGTILKVTNVDNGLSVLVRINDRGPFIGNRILDLSYSASIEIGNTGLSKVLIEGFIPGRVNIGNNVSDIYFFGYSISKPMAFIHKTDADVIGFSRDFNEGIKLYKNYLARHPENVSYLAVPSEQIMKKEKYADKFYLVVIDPRSKKKIIEIVRDTR
ncbi:MAG: septal ring lytic transglycosylase RlpA family protein [Bacteroidetes bacterium]|nr:septal ring lytic transglycosylase RlpA family protein [Bacteroidota bacterium]